MVGFEFEGGATFGFGAGFAYVRRSPLNASRVCVKESWARRHLPAASRSSWNAVSVRNFIIASWLSAGFYDDTLRRHAAGLAPTRRENMRVKCG